MIVFEEVVALKESVLEEAEAALDLVLGTLCDACTAVYICLIPSLAPATTLMFSRDWGLSHTRCVL